MEKKQSEMNLLRDKAFQIFLSHYFSIDWLREMTLKRKIFESMQARPAGMFQNRFESNEILLFFLVRLSLDFYPTCSILEKIMQILDHPYGQIILDSDKFYFFGFLLEMERKYRSNQEISILCTELLKIPFQQQCLSTSFGILFGLLCKVEPVELPITVANDWSEHIYSVVSLKYETERILYEKDLLYFFKELAKPFSAYSNQIEGISANSLFQSFQRDENSLIVYALKYIQDHGLLVDENVQLHRLITCIQCIKYQELLRRNISYSRRILKCMMRLNPVAIEKYLIPFTTFINDIEPLVNINVDGTIEGYLTNYTNHRIDFWAYFLDGLNSQFRIIYQTMSAETPSSLPDWFVTEFSTQKNLCFERLFDILEKVYLIPVKPITEMDSITKHNRNLHLCVLYLHEACKVFDQKRINDLRLLGCFSVWQENYLKNYLNYMKDLSTKMDRLDPPSFAVLTSQLENIRVFNYDGIVYELTQFIQTANIFADPDTRLLQESVINIAYIVIRQFPLLPFTSISGVLTKLRKLFSLLTLEKEIQLVARVQAELRQLYPNIEASLLNELDWDQRPAIQQLFSLIAQFFSELNSNPQHFMIELKGLNTVLDNMLLMGDDILSLYRTHEIISALVTSVNVLPPDMLIILLGKQQKLKEWVFKAAFDCVQELVATSSLFYDYPAITKEFFYYFSIVDPRQRITSTLKAFSYGKYLSFFDSTAAKYPQLESHCQIAINLIVAALPSLSALTNISIGMLDELLQQIQELIEKIVKQGFKNEIILPNLLVLLQCYQELFTAVMGGIPEKYWTNMLKHLKTAGNELKRKTFIPQFIEIWRDAYQYWPQVSSSYHRIMTSSQSLSVKGEGSKAESFKTVVSRFLYQLYSIHSLQCLKKRSDRLDWLLESIPFFAQPVDSSETDQDFLYRQFLSGVFIILKGLLNVFASDGSPGVVQEHRIYSLEMIMKQEKNQEMYTNFPTDYSYFIICQCDSRLLPILSISFAWLFERSIFNFLYNEGVGGNTTPPSHQVYQFFYFLDGMETLKNRPHQIMKITQEDIWWNCTKSNSKFWAGEGTWKAFEYYQQCESFLTFDLISTEEYQRLTSFFLTNPDLQSIQENLDSRRCYEEAKGFYDNACRLYLEWRELVGSEEQEEVDVKGKKLIEVYQELNLLFLAIYYSHNFLLITKKKTLQKAQINYEKEKDRLKLYLFPHRIRQQL